MVIRYPHQRHGNAGKQSNVAKTSTMNDFLSFVDSNCQPNGRTAQSHGPTYYFISKFATIQMPKKDVSKGCLLSMHFVVECGTRIAIVLL